MEKQQRSFNAELERRFLDPAVSIFLLLNRNKDALKWVVGVAEISGANVVAHMRIGPKFRALHKYKQFQRLFQPGAERARLRIDLTATIAMWKNDEYDNYKDVIEDSKSLLKDAQRLDKKLVGKAQKHHDEILKEARQLMAEDAVARDYLNGLVPA